MDLAKRVSLMSTFQNVREKIRKLPPGAVITLDDFKGLNAPRSALAVALSRLTREGTVNRLRRGFYLKPKDSRFGSLPPNSGAMIAAIGLQGKKSYISGLSAFNKLGLTTQVPNIISLKGGVTNSSFKAGGTRIEVKAGRSPKAPRDIPLLVLLDSLREIKSIPDSNVDESVKILKKKISELDKNQKVRLVSLALADKPKVRALLGAILDESNPEITEILFQGLNQLTTYKIGISSLEFARKWRIK